MSAHYEIVDGKLIPYDGDLNDLVAAGRPWAITCLTRQSAARLAGTWAELGAIKDETPDAFRRDTP